MAQTGTEANEAAALTDEQREAITVTAYDLQLHLDPAASRLSAVARLTVNNGGSAPLPKVALQLSSTLVWEGVSGRSGGGAPMKLAFDQHRIDTDADHTGAAAEAVIKLATPLAPGASVELTMLYSGKVERSGARLVRAGETIDEAAAADWDAIQPEATALRGFGNVLWYPVASAQVFLGDGARLAEAIATQRRRQQGATVRLRVEIESGGVTPDSGQPAAAGENSSRSSSSSSSDALPDSSSGVLSGGSASSGSASGGSAPSGSSPGSLDSGRSVAPVGALGAAPRVVPTAPAVAFFCGRPAAFSVVNAGTARGGEGDESATPAIATVEWTAAPLGFGPLSLFVFGEAPVATEGLVAVAGGLVAEVARVEAAAKLAEPLIAEWLGSPREREPVLLAHAGQPFGQRALLVESAKKAASSFAMTHLESHAWFSSPEVWLDEGVAQFLPLVAIEREQGRPAAVAQLRDLQPALSLADATGAPGVGVPAKGLVPSEALVDASREVFFRNKAVSVLWMLRAVAGDAAMQSALAGMRHLPEGERGAKAFQRGLEQASGKDLGWFFRDWVFADRGLPDLAIVSASPRALAGIKGGLTGNLVAVEVRNDGGAEAEVPVTVRSGELTATERLRVPAHGSASMRILFQGTPEQVEVNDGTVPEVGASEHLLRFTRPAGDEDHSSQ